LSAWTNGFIPVARGIEFGYFLNQGKLNENTVRQGHNYWITGLFQSMQVYFAQSQVGEALSAAGRSIKIPYGLSNATLLVPFLFSWAASCKIKSNFVKKAVYLIHDNIGTLSQIAGVVSSVALIAFGHIAFGVAALTCLGIGFLDRQGFLPEKLRHILHTSDFYVSNVTALLIGSPIEKIISLVDVAVFVTNKIFSFRAEKLKKKHEHSGKTHLTLEKVQQLPEKPKVEVNEGHLHNKPLKELITPDESLDELIKLCDAIDWNSTRHFPALRAKLARDERWTHRDGLQGKEVEYLKQNLKIFVRDIKKRHISVGEPKNYDILTKYCKHIIADIKKKDDITQADALMRLAIEGGEYCGPARYEVAEDLFSNLILHRPKLPLEIRMLMLLQHQRGTIFKSIYYWQWNNHFVNKGLGKAINYQDVHVYNQMAGIVGEDFGLPAKGAKHDTTAVTGPLIELIISKVYYAQNQLFWKGGKKKVNGRDYDIQGYTADHIAQTIINATGSKLLPLPDVYDWWGTWLKNQKELPQAKRAEFEKLRSEGGLDEEHEGKRRLKRKYAVAMLLEMGVLKFPKPDIS